MFEHHYGLLMIKSPLLKALLQRLAHSVDRSPRAHRSRPTHRLPLTDFSPYSHEPRLSHRSPIVLRTIQSTINMTKRSLFQSSLTQRFKASRTSLASSPRSASQSEEQLADHRNKNPIRTVNEAVSVVSRTLDGEVTGYDVVPWKSFAPNWKKRAPVFCEFEILCLANTHQHMGWAICSHVRNGLCQPSSGVKRYNPSSGNTAFHRHVEQHAIEASNIAPSLFSVPSDEKKLISTAAAKVYAYDMQPLSFCHGKKGMKEFAAALIRLGQNYPPSTEIDVSKLLPCYNTVRKEVITLSKVVQSEFKIELPKILEQGGAVTCDGVKLESNGKKYYNFNVSYLEVQRRKGPPSSGYEWKIRSRLVFLANHKGSESADCIRETIEKNLKSTTGFELSAFENNFTHVTDCAPVMARVFKASVSPNQIPYSARWVGCISHQLDTVMKNVITAEPIISSEISKNLNLVKSIVSTVKHADFNQEMPDGYSLLQESPTRFGTTFDVVKRFLKSAEQLQLLISSKSGDSKDKISKNLSKLSTSTFDNRKCYPALEAILDVFASIRHAQTELESSKKPTLVKVLPMLEELKTKLTFQSSGIVDPSTNVAPSEHTQLLAKRTLEALNNIDYHDLWCASCFLHPGLSSFSFCSPSVASLCKRRGESLVRQMVLDFEARKEGIPSNTVHSPNTTSVQNIPNVRGTLGESSWSLSNKMSFLCSPKSSNDEVSRFMSLVLSSSSVNMLKNDGGEVDFWLSMKADMPTLSAIALKVSVTPASSATSERDFSALKLSVPSNSSCLKDDIINAKAVLYSSASD